MRDFVEVDTSRLEAAVDALEDEIGGVAAVLPAIANMLVGQVADEFETEGQGQWEPFADSTLKGRRGKGNPKLLQDTGVFAGSIHGEHGIDFAEAATNVPYAVYHVMGTKNMAARDPFDVDEDSTLDEAEELVWRHLGLL